nr:udp-n-acetylglucosamine transferase subunit alg13 [Quercus suber]
MPSPLPPARKTCFVTVGATASFSALIESVLSPSFVHALREHAYTELVVQYGADGETLFTTRKRTSPAVGIQISGFALDPSGLGRHMQAAQGRGDGSSAREGVVVSHAGSGTVLEALRLGIPLIVVPNNALLDDHQVELAEALAAQGYVVHARLDALEVALADAEGLRVRQRAWPPVNSGVHRQGGGGGGVGLKAVIDEEMGYLD